MIDLKAAYEEALLEKEEVLVTLKPLREKENTAIEKKQIAEKELQDIRDEIANIEKERDLAGISKVIATLAPNQKKLTNG